MLSFFKKKKEESWFSYLYGFDENVQDVYKNLVVDGDFLVSKVNKKKYNIGKYELISLKELRLRVGDRVGSKVKVNLIKENISNIHLNHPNSLIQVASQTNGLEMQHCTITPEQGITNYQKDKTQGPECAIAASAGTIFRNYFIPLGTQRGKLKTIKSIPYQI